jgi:thioredoxin-related protein
METGTFLTENVREHVSKYFVPLKYESGRDAEQFLRFGISASPSYVFLDSKGNEVHRIIGFHSEKDFIKQADYARTHAAKS